VDADAFLRRLVSQRYYQDQIVHIEDVPAREADYADVPGGLHPAIAAALARDGVEHLYRHQAEAIAHVRAGRDVVVVTGTASGKTLCYNIPVVETLADDPAATALYLFPTKALAQDQLRTLARFQAEEPTKSKAKGKRRKAKEEKDEGERMKDEAASGQGEGFDLHPSSFILHPSPGVRFFAGVFDGDTPQNLRRKVRDGANVVLTNPDMLHQGILPQHARWNRFFSRLKYVVLDEVHVYRGVFGSHLANVLRRLDRICRHYGASPRFVCCSATIGNPREHAEHLVGRPMALVDQDGSPRGRKHFVFWNPPVIEGAAQGADSENWRVGGNRRSSLWEAVHLLTGLVKEEIQTIAFVQTRLAAELLFKNTRDMLRPVSRRLAESVQAYRGGYLPEERRNIERRLVAREILGVASTNALELGIDIGTLEACILVGYPGAVASFWQRAGRAGRGREDALIFFVGLNAPMDQYLMQHCAYLFGRSPEQAIVDPDNPHIAVGHLKCATHELPLDADELAAFGGYAPMLMDLLEEQESVKRIENRYYWTRSEYPAAEVNLRNMSGVVYTIQDDTDGAKIIGTLDEVSALSQLHDHAVYLHGAETYFVRQLDLDQKIAHVEKRDLDYYTQSVQVSQIRVDNTEESIEWPEEEGRLTRAEPLARQAELHTGAIPEPQSYGIPPAVGQTFVVPASAGNEFVVPPSGGPSNAAAPAGGWVEGSDASTEESVDRLKPALQTAPSLPPPALDHLLSAPGLQLAAPELPPPAPGLLGFGDVTVTTSIPMFKKIRFHSRDSLGFEKLELPPQELETVSLWFCPPEDLVREMISRRLVAAEALIGIANVLVEVAPLYVLCDPRDIGTVVDSGPLKRDGLFLYDRYPGGVGYARRCLDNFQDLLRTVRDVVRDCQCDDGCPSCVGSAIPPFAMTDADASVRGRIPDKAGARFLLDELLRGQ
jgi:DEAD/DEAH box helicase domain-containing protein